MSQILATLGPAIGNKTINLKKFIRKTDILRLNLSHNTITWHQGMIKKIKKIDKKKKILVDIPGVKPRTLNTDKIYIKKNQIVKFSYDNRSQEIIGLSNPIPKLNSKPSTFSLSDGQFTFKFISFKKNILSGKSLSNFELQPKKGPNLPDSIYDDDLQKKVYLKYIKKIYKFGFDYIGLSFIQDANILGFLKKKYPDIILVSKLENSIGYKNRKEIIKNSDAVMIDRGDLAAEVGISNLTLFSDKIIEECRLNKKPVIVATENFNSLIDNNIPSKSDVLNLDYYLLKKVDIIMLSDETATSVNWLNTLNWLNEYLDHKKKNVTIENFPSPNIFNILKNIQNSVLLIFSKKGYFFKNIPTHSYKKIFLFTENKKLIKLSKLYNNVEPKFVNFKKKNVDKLIYKNIEEKSKEIFRDINFAYVVNVIFPRKNSRANTISIISKKDIIKR